MSYPCRPTPPDAAPLACRRCSAKLGVSRGTHVELGAVRVCQRVVLTCAACGLKRAWRPDGNARAAGG